MMSLEASTESNRWFDEGKINFEFKKFEIFQNRKTFLASFGDARLLLVQVFDSAGDVSELAGCKVYCNFNIKLVKNVFGCLYWIHINISSRGLKYFNFWLKKIKVFWRLQDRRGGDASISN